MATDRKCPTCGAPTAAGKGDARPGPSTAKILLIVFGALIVVGLFVLLVIGGFASLWLCRLSSGEAARVEMVEPQPVSVVQRAPAGPAPTIEFRAAEEGPSPALTEAAVADSDRRVYLRAEVLLSNEDIQFATVKPGVQDGDVRTIEIVFTEAGARRFAEVTAAMIGKPLAIVVDGKVVSAPVVRDRISGGRAVITGTFSAAEAQRIANGITGRR